MTTLAMPAAKSDVLARRAETVAALRAIVPGEGTVDDETGMRPYKPDALTAYTPMPFVVVLPETAERCARC